MKIIHIEQKPIATMAYYRVRKGNRGRERVEWPFYSVSVDRLPKGCAALLATSDLQGMETVRGNGKWGRLGSRLVGHAVAEYAVELLRERGIDSKRTGVLLAGDLHADPTLQRRGGHGDVREVWTAFRDRFAWCAGVAGNHDVFGSDLDMEQFMRQPGVHLLNGHVVELGDWRVGGVSGVMGTNPNKPWRQAPEKFKELVHRVLKSRLHIMLLHEGPGIQELDLQGQDVTRDYLEAGSPSFVICGHRHWPGNRVETLRNGTRVLNVEGKTVVITEHGNGVMGT
jgi:Icc protein